MRRRLESVIGGVALLAVIVVVAGLASPFHLEQRGLDASWTPPPVTTAPLPAPTVQPTEPITSDVPWHTILTVVAVVLLLLLFATTLRQLLSLRARRREEFFAMEGVGPEDDVAAPGGVVNLPALADAVDEALQRLDDIHEPRDAVVAAWVELEKAAARQGWERDPAETTTEFTAHLLEVSPAPRDATATLRSLYQQARFADRPVDQAQVARARAALEAIARKVAP